MHHGPSLLEVIPINEISPTEYVMGEKTVLEEFWLQQQRFNTNFNIENNECEQERISQVLLECL